MAMILVSSPKYDLRYRWIVVVVFLLPLLFSNLFGLSLGRSFQNLALLCPSLFQCEP
jgi:hypothetical protein